eukprot:7199695-Prymnesium_polylepis.1
MLPALPALSPLCLFGETESTAVSGEPCVRARDRIVHLASFVAVASACGMLWPAARANIALPFSLLLPAEPDARVGLPGSVRACARARACVQGRIATSHE